MPLPLSMSGTPCTDALLETMFYHHNQVQGRASSERVPVAPMSHPPHASCRLLKDGAHDASKNRRRNMGGGHGVVRQRLHESIQAHPSRHVTSRAR